MNDGPFILPHLLAEEGEELMPQTTGRSEARLIGFQCTAEEYRQIVAAAEENEQTTSEWIRKTLREAILKPRGTG